MHSAPAPRHSRHAFRARALLLGTALALLAGCGRDRPLDLDMRGFGDGLDTSVAGETAPPPQPDDRGVISYPTYQVVVGRPGETVADVAGRLDLSAEALGRYNGIEADTRLRGGEVIALPERVAEPSAATGAPGGRGEIDVATLAGEAIERAEPAGEGETGQAESSAPTGQGTEPIRHRVTSGETAYSIARRYDVAVEALAEWNGLGPDYSVREGQQLLIPVARTRSAAAGPPEDEGSNTTTPPGAGSPTPTPPSASEPLPEEDTAPAGSQEATESTPPSPELDEERTSASTSTQLSMPVSGSIIRDYAPGENEGLDISAAAGTPVSAAADGTVAAITRDTEQVPILVVRHSGELLTVYANIDSIDVEQGDSVSRGHTVAEVREGDPAFVHFEVREGFESVDPTPYLN